MWCPNSVTQTTAGSVVNHTNVLQTLWHIEIMDEAIYWSGINVVLGPDRNQLASNELSVLPRLTWFLWANKLSKIP